MSLLDIFYQKFVERHNFEDSDIDIFLNRWKNKTIFKNIPLAWIIPLDTMMFELNKNNFVVKSVIQEYGQLIVSIPIDANTIKANKIIKSVINKIENIDKDLYLLFDEDIRHLYFQQRYNEIIKKHHLPEHLKEDKN